MRWNLLVELAHMTMEAEKSHNSPSIHWRTREANTRFKVPKPQIRWCNTQSKAKGPAAQGATGTSPTVQKPENVEF